MPPPGPLIFDLRVRALLCAVFNAFCRYLLSSSLFSGPGSANTKRLPGYNPGSRLHQWLPPLQVPTSRSEALHLYVSLCSICLIYGAAIELDQLSRCHGGLHINYKRLQEAVVQATTRSGGLFRIKLPSLVSDPDFLCKACHGRIMQQIRASVYLPSGTSSYISTANFGVRRRLVAPTAQGNR